jgi:hypothetical protein
MKIEHTRKLNEGSTTELNTKLNQPEQIGHYNCGLREQGGPLTRHLRMKETKVKSGCDPSRVRSIDL